MEKIFKGENSHLKNFDDLFRIPKAGKKQRPNKIQWAHFGRILGRNAEICRETEKACLCPKALV